MGFFGVLMMLGARREIRRLSDLPPFREYLRVARWWEVLLTFAGPVLFAASLFGPWAATGSPLWGLMGFVASAVLWSVLAVPVLIIAAIRHPEPLGTHWDGQKWAHGPYRMADPGPRPSRT
jgi:hypothetical protein